MLPFALAHAEPPDLTTLAARVTPSVVLLEVTGPLGQPTGTGTGFFIDGAIVTNHHVIAGATDVTATRSDGTEIAIAGILADDADRDIALLAPEGGPYPALTLGSTKGLATGTEVVVIGSPMGLSASLTAGVVSAVRADGIPEELREDDQGLAAWGLQISAAISPGSSGSPILTRNGDVVGVAVGVLVNPGDTLSFGVLSDVVAEVAAARGKEPVSFTAEADHARNVNLGISAVFFAVLAAGWAVLKRRSAGGKR